MHLKLRKALTPKTYKFAKNKLQSVNKIFHT